MKNTLIIALLLFTGFAVNAQSTSVTDTDKLFIGTWEVQQGKPKVRLKSLTFYADGTINMDYAKEKRVQRYKIGKDDQGYSIQTLELITGKPLEAINIHKFSKEEMEIAVKDDGQDFIIRFKKVST